MARFLSDAWFAELSGMALNGAPSSPREHLASPGPSVELVVEVIASGAPEGEVRYQIVVEREGPKLVARREDFRPPHVELRAGYETLAGIASGALSAIDALSTGRARVSGDISVLSVNQDRLGSLDLLPPAVRATTTFE